MSQVSKGDEVGGGMDPGGRALAFIDHRRQDYAGRVPMPDGADFLVGDYREDGGCGVGELRIALHDLGDRHGLLSPQLCVFGDGSAALAALLGLTGGDLAWLLRPVGDHPGFCRRLLALGMRDASDHPLEGGR